MYREKFYVTKYFLIYFQKIEWLIVKYRCIQCFVNLICILFFFLKTFFLFKTSIIKSRLASRITLEKLPIQYSILFYSIKMMKQLTNEKIKNFKKKF